MNAYIQIYWTACDMQEAKEISSYLVEKKLVACANIIPMIESIYLWKGKVENSHETKVIFKTRKEKFAEIKEIILEKAKYEVPEILMIPIIDGHKEYLDWVDDCINRHIS